ncbi:MAG: pyruvate ferredoxin oxidoreductase [Candidatus Altiarchaeales archaeon WOR_SM1_86-2]|nr:MAG: pyruvate ferredoxin oxidoreductase [Candidatus Altiarchaeales archaeon WOR_SM1_86-2]
MKQVRFHGRGGQGAVTAADVLAVAVFKDGKYSQAFPAFGVERRGAPVQAFARISDKFVRDRSQIYEPDYVVVLDPTLIEIAGVTEGLSKQGKLVINSEKEHAVDGFDTYFVDATQIAIDNLGVPIVNTAMLGAFAGATKEVTFESLKEALMERFGGRLGPKNCKAAEIAYKEVKKF